MTINDWENLFLIQHIWHIFIFGEGELYTYNLYIYRYISRRVVLRLCYLKSILIDTKQKVLIKFHLTYFISFIFIIIWQVKLFYGKKVKINGLFLCNRWKATTMKKKNYLSIPPYQQNYINIAYLQNIFILGFL